MRTDCQLLEQLHGLRTTHFWIQAPYGGDQSDSWSDHLVI